MNSARSFLTFLVVIALPACLDDPAVSAVEAPQVPTVTGLSVTHAAVGAPVEIFGSDFIDPELGWVDVTFDGEYITTDGTRESANITIPLLRDPEDPTRLAWARFGAYSIPFGDGTSLGRFEGAVYATNRSFDGESIPQAEDTRASVRFEVDPSITVSRFHAMNESFVADCAEPATTILEQIPYGMVVETRGFEPARVSFTLSAGWMMNGEIQDSAGTFVQEGFNGDQEAALILAFGPVPELEEGYSARVDVFIEDTEGNEHVLVYPIVVRRPVQAYFESRARVAEIFPAEQVSGCIPGGDTIREVTYSESRTETRTRSVSHSEDVGWTQTYGREHDESWGLDESAGGRSIEGRSVQTTNSLADGGSTTMSTNVTDTAGRMRETNVELNGSAGGTVEWRVAADRSANWSAGASVGAEAGGSVGVPFVAEGSAKVSAQVSGQYGQAWSGEFRGQQDCLDEGDENCTIDRVGQIQRAESERWDEGWRRGERDSVSEQQAISAGRSASTNWTATQSLAEANSFSNEQNWLRQRSYNQSVQRSESLASSLGETETETFTVSTAESTTLSISGPIFVDQFGVWYRQTTRLVRRGVLVAYDFCGNGSPVAELTIDDWTWAPDLANGTSCPPETNLPPAECLEPPCLRD